VVKASGEVNFEGDIPAAGLASNREKVFFMNASSVKFPEHDSKQTSPDLNY
jgi:hypothetical protein